MYTGIHVKNSLCLSYFNETWIFPTDFRYSVIKFHEDLLRNFISDIPELVVTFRNFVNAPTKVSLKITV
jgi:hypothetical protein